MIRKLALRVVNWLIARFDLSVVAETRLLGGTDAVERGARWEAFMNETGGLREMIDALRREAFEAAAELDPTEVEKIHYWATADRNLRKLQQRVEGIVQHGRIEADRVKTIERMNAANTNLAAIRR